MSKTVTFEYHGRTVTAHRQTNRKREEIRQVTRRLGKLRGDMSVGTSEEFAASLVLPISGDEHVWKRPSPTCDDVTLLEALNFWLDEMDSTFVDSLWQAAVSANGYDPVTATQPPAGEPNDPNSDGNERITSKKS